MEQIIYDDDELRVMYSAQDSDLLIITFGNLNNLADGTNYFGKKPLAKMNYSAIGFMAKHSNWFPRKNMLHAKASIQAILNTYARKIVYGGSMGGYAAIKYSKTLEASHVLAMCPQWSIDPQECEGWNPGWQEHFQPSMRGMAINAQDLGGQIYLFCDFHYPLDQKHASSIAQLADNVHLINVPFTHHHVTTVLAGTANLRALIDACQQDDVHAIHRICRQARKTSEIYQKNALKVAAKKTPNHFLSYLSQKQHRYWFRKKPLLAIWFLRNTVKRLLASSI